MSFVELNLAPEQALEQADACLRLAREIGAGNEALLPAGQDLLRRIGKPSSVVAPLPTTFGGRLPADFRTSQASGSDRDDADAALAERADTSSSTNGSNAHAPPPPLGPARADSILAASKPTVTAARPKVRRRRSGSVL